MCEGLVQFAVRHGNLVRRGEASWTFAPEGDGTRVVWHYTFELTSPLAYPVAALVMILFRRWMASGLERLAALCAS